MEIGGKENRVLVIYSPRDLRSLDTLIGPLSEAKAHFVQEAMEVEDHSEILILESATPEVLREWQERAKKLAYTQLYETSRSLYDALKEERFLNADDLDRLGKALNVIEKEGR